MTFSEGLLESEERNRIAKASTATGQKDGPPLLRTLVEQCSSEILILLGSRYGTAFYLNWLGVAINEAAARGIKVRVLTSSSEIVAGEVFAGLQWQRTEEINLGMIVLDRSSVAFIQFAQEPCNQEDDDTLISPIYMTNPLTVEGVAAIFETLWRESESRKEERRACRNFELLKESITTGLDQCFHVSESIVELMKYKSGADEEMKKLALALEISIDCSKALVQRARRMGRLLSKDRGKLDPIDLVLSLKESVEEVSRVFGGKRLELLLTFVTEDGIETTEPKFPCLVLADGLLVDVFTNIIFAVARPSYDESFVPVKVTVEKSDLKESGLNKSFWKVTILGSRNVRPLDRDDDGLGAILSYGMRSSIDIEIARELIVNRYSGSIGMKELEKKTGNEVRGIVVEVILPTASA
jgi:hypothetical protein